MVLGNLVALKSNPERAMTIEKVDNQIITCVWIHSDGSLKREELKQSMLELTDTSSFKIADSITNFLTDFLKEL